ncbi:hypothetical protein K5D34_18685 [Pseudomonas cichorii]|uniref:Uncharacterized protein n=1 Tax=Pseudomonas lijiangensis TaxID=2995658 RepID=A0ABX8HKZ0_9PSED|nr:MULTISPECIES: hypothetical protein [Pseudomonas syringae group]MBX8488338.1 hypothetical protein [Pseudomonas cichorii]MBX8498357.1 hypothetical protein [Pseudomonas lijiangensis]MBX8503264.1 hypothetical protein [Pseudomonas lijiangensis]MBX8511714.1 hypothetical protein [Pseudomonas cichorii]MBX8519046.1 hypothetical protein [Pseudomonas cichorii]
MEIDENAPGNVSQSPATRPTDSETGFDADPAVDDLNNDESDDPDLPVNPPIDEDEEPPLR